MEVLKKTMKELIKKNLYRRGYCIHKRGESNFFPSLMEAFLRKNSTVFFIQIGANDGKSFDPIYDFTTSNSESVRGILLEPIPDYFEELKRNYKGYPNVILLNLAIHNSAKEMVIHRVDPRRIERGELPRWAKGIASFNEHHHELSGTPRDAIVEQKVKCISIGDLLKEHQVSEIDLLQIDTEGYDAEIISSLDFTIIKPKIIHFEHGLEHGIISKDQIFNLKELLHNNGYELWMDRYDATAYQFDVLLDL